MATTWSFSEPSLYKNVIHLIHLATWHPHAVAYGWWRKAIVFTLQAFLSSIPTSITTKNSQIPHPAKPIVDPPFHLIRFSKGLSTIFNSPHRTSVHHVEKLQVGSLLEYIVDELSSRWLRLISWVNTWYRWVFF